MAEKRIIDISGKKIDLRDDDVATALIYFGRFEVSGWEELFFAAVKSLYLEYPSVINSLCSTDPENVLFLRTNKIGMKAPQRIDSIIFLETKRTPPQIIQALKIIFRRADVLNINMQIEVMSLEEIQKPNLEKLYTPVVKKEIEEAPKPEIVFREKIPKFTPDQSLDEMLATLDEMPLQAFKKKPSRIFSMPESNLNAPTFGGLFFQIGGTRYGPFADEKNRYAALMYCLAENFPEQMIKIAGKHINSTTHRLTLVQGESYLYFIEPAALPNNLYIDKGFPDKILIENEKYFLERCGMNFKTVMQG